LSLDHVQDRGLRLRMSRRSRCRVDPATSRLLGMTAVVREDRRRSSSRDDRQGEQEQDPAATMRRPAAAHLRECRARQL